MYLLEATMSIAVGREVYESVTAHVDLGQADMVVMLTVKDSTRCC